MTRDRSQHGSPGSLTRLLLKKDESEPNNPLDRNAGVFGTGIGKPISSQNSARLSVDGRRESRRDPKALEHQARSPQAQRSRLVPQAATQKQPADA